MLAAAAWAALSGAPLVSVGAEAAAAPPPRVDVATLDYGLQAHALAPGLYVVAGTNADFSKANGCNIINTGFIVGDDGVLVINTGPTKRYGEQLRALIGRTTDKPVKAVLHLNLHPDYFLGSQAFADVPRYATEATRAGMAREATAYVDNLYRLCGEWARGTEPLLPDQTIAATGQPQPWSPAGRSLQLAAFRGHTDSDLIVIDPASKVAFVGGLVFADRVPTTPHADLAVWLQTLSRLPATLDAFQVQTLVPSHGPVRPGRAGITQTAHYLDWLDVHLHLWAERGDTINDILRSDVPADVRAMAAFDTEFTRNIVHLYPRYEQAAFGAGQPLRR